MRHAPAQGAWHITSHLSQVVTLLPGESGRLLVSALRPGQEVWIHGRLLTVAALLGLPQTVLISQIVASRILTKFPRIKLVLGRDY
jgi:hypothetical protein